MYVQQEHMLGKMAEVYAEHGLHIYSIYVVVAINYARM